MVVGVHRRAVGVFSNRKDVENALHELKVSGFPMDRVSVIKQDTDNQSEIAGTQVKEKIDNKADEGAAAGAISGGTLGGLTGLLIGLGTLAIPGIGPIMLAGAAATAIATTLAGVGIGVAAGGLLGALIGLGIPEERAKVYHERVERGDYLVIIDGTDEELARAEAILRPHRIEEFATYNLPVTNSARPEHTATPVQKTNSIPSGHTTTPVQQTRRAIGVFSNHHDAEVALTDLRNSGFPMSQVSLIAKNSDRNNLNKTDINRKLDAGNKADEGATTGATTGAVLGGLGGLLVGLGALAIPGIGPVILGGAAATALATAATGGAIGAATGGLAGALIGWGIPEEHAQIYSDRVQQGHYMVIVDGTPDEVHRAEMILRHRGIKDFNIFDANNTESIRSQTSVPTSDLPRYDRKDPAVIIIDRRDNDT